MPLTDEQRRSELEARLRGAQEQLQGAEQAAANAATTRAGVVRDAVASGVLTQAEIARIIGVGRARIGQILRPTS